jgi:hypothetical protein
VKKDIVHPEVSDVGVAVVREENDEGQLVWNVYLVNMHRESLTGVLVSSRGYGEIDKERRDTSVLRHFLDDVPARAAKRIEPIVEEVFGLFNEYWVSFKLGTEMFDKKYIFAAESIKEEHFVEIPCTDMRGVFIK